MSKEETITIGRANESMELNLRILDGFNISIKSINFEETAFGRSIMIRDKYNNTFFSYSQILQEQVEGVNKATKEGKGQYIIAGVSVNSKKQVFLTKPYENESFKKRTGKFLREIQLIDEYMKLEQEKELLGVRIQKVLSLLKYSGNRSDYRKSALSERKKILSEELNLTRKKEAKN